MVEFNAAPGPCGVTGAVLYFFELSRAADNPSLALAAWAFALEVEVFFGHSLTLCSAPLQNMQRLLVNQQACSSEVSLLSFLSLLERLGFLFCPQPFYIPTIFFIVLWQGCTWACRQFKCYIHFQIGIWDWDTKLVSLMVHVIHSSSYLKLRQTISSRGIFHQYEVFRGNAELQATPRWLYLQHNKQKFWCPRCKEVVGLYFQQDCMFVTL